MGWADDELKKEHKRTESQQVDEELRLREERMKDEVGVGLFLQIKKYVEKEVMKYNSIADGMSFIPDSSYLEEGDVMSRIPSFSVRKKDGRCHQVYVKYSTSRHILMWRCGSLERSFEVRVHADGKGYFVDTEGTPCTPEEMGKMILTQAKNAGPTSGAVWA